MTELPLDLIERIERYLASNLELQGRHNEILRDCELQLSCISVGIFALANLTTPALPEDLMYAEQHANTVRQRRRKA